ncbi:trehalose 6-phosphate phosphatase [Streptomyces spiroverticillatus]|uniref:Trehalose 6-phosphate phosphatase n=1 Tax=Streptomyces finlayi TaxID=67296 RepID=A0A918WTB2_9ACTN|nr:trehalose-phosphatase [Streptomyces finlayi]GGZ95924.1 trehalose 6-phosphate phosphatase [Streptomyces spiroverticillatus]GHC81498.1 trehalose 6-phosphate phosphatase [Streptomyces finlayi]
MDTLPEPSTPAGREALAALLGDPARALVALDFDGTLADIVPDPEQARAHPGAVPALAALAPHVASVAIVTGRPAGVAVRYGGFAGVAGLEHLVVLGHYGAERWDALTGTVHAPSPHPGIAAARAELPGVLDAHGAWRGTWVEEKGQAVAVHTRRATDPEAAFEALRAPLAELAAQHGLILEPGRLVLELRPPGVDKGVALEAYVREVGARCVVYAGDDLGDLPAYAAVEKLRSDGIPGLLLCSGTAIPELAEQADVLLPGPAEVTAFLARLAQRLAE